MKWALHVGYMAGIRNATELSVGKQDRKGPSSEQKIQRYSGVPRGGGVKSPPPEIPKALQNRAKLNPIVKTVKNC